MTQDQVIAAAREAGVWIAMGSDKLKEVEALQRFYAIAFAQGMERAAEICDANQDFEIDNHAARITFSVANVMARKCAAAIRAEAHAKNQPESTHDTGNV